MKEKIRKPVCAGSWYSNDYDTLSAEIDSYLSNVRNQDLKPKAVIVPHAGYMFSGQTAAHSFRQIDEGVKKVIILGTAHRYPLSGVCVIDYDYYDSPLGKVRLDKSLKNVTKEKQVVSVPEADIEEHSIEIEIPFLQRVLKDFTIIPMIVGKIEPVEFSKLLAKYSDDETVIVVSVDLSHFHSYKKAVELDNYSINAVLNLDTKSVEKAEIDSPYAVMSVIELAKRKKWKVKLLDYKNSGDIIHDRTSVVGYSSIAFYEEREGYFSEEEKEKMRELAKLSVESYVREGKRASMENAPVLFSKKLACFVTLRDRNDLRGCIGTIEPFDTLYNSIIDNAIGAASRDYRFDPVTEKELEGLSYEVSVLTPPVPVKPLSEEHLFSLIKDKGVIIEKGFYRAVYLPQVWEHFKTEGEFLGSLCRKAGMSGNEWKKYKDMSFYIFNLVE